MPKIRCPRFGCNGIGLPAGTKNMSKSLESTSKYLSLILRHKPETIGIELDEHGWADVEELIRGILRTTF